MEKAKYNLKVEKAEFLEGKIKAPPSKSYTIRSLISASLDGDVRVLNPLHSEDTEAAIRALRKLGAVITRENSFLRVAGFRGVPLLEGANINVGESGTLLRMILPIVALGMGRFLINGEGTLLKRSNRPIAEALLSLGIDIKGRDSEYRLPILIEGKGNIAGGRVEISAKMSSQTISSLLNIAPLAKEDVTVIVKDKVVSKPYIDITIDVLSQSAILVKQEGYRKFLVKAGQSFRPKGDFVIHGDYSSAAFIIAACCLIKSKVVIADMARDKQGDSKIIGILNEMGAKIKYSNNQIAINGPFELKGIDIDCSDTPDLVPILAAVGCFAKGKMKISNIGHLVHKESNRITAPASQLQKLGAKISIKRDGLTIGHSNLAPGCVSSCFDHRIAMALAVVGLKIGGVAIERADCISKSYPNFISDMKSLGADLK